MKKRERYKFAMYTVLESNLSPADKLEIIDTLLADKALADWNESKEEEK